MASDESACLDLFSLSEKFPLEWWSPCSPPPPVCKGVLSERCKGQQNAWPNPSDFRSLSLLRRVTFIITNHKDSHACGQRRKSSLEGSFRDISMQNEQSEGWAGLSLHWATCGRFSDLTLLSLHLPFTFLYWGRRSQSGCVEVRIFFGATFNQQAGGHRPQNRILNIDILKVWKELRKRAKKWDREGKSAYKWCV